MTTPPPGWYPDPAYPGAQRWWTGSSWSADTTMGASPAPPSSATGRTGIVVAVVLMVIGVGLVVPGLVFVARGFIDEVVLSPTMAVPGTRSFVLASGDYELYEAEGPGAIPALTLSVTGPDGASVPVYAPSGVATITRGGVQYGATVGFQAATAGDYTLTVQTGASAPPGRVIVAQSLTSVLRSLAGWAVAVVVGMVSGVAGIVVLVVSIVRYRRARSLRARLGPSVVA